MQNERRGRSRKFFSTDRRIPTTAPELWQGVRSGGETLADFFRRVWGPSLPYGLQSVQIRRMDATLWKALHQHIVRYVQPWPADLAIPNLTPKLLPIITKLNDGRWEELSDDEIIAALKKRQRDRATQELEALETRRRELRASKAALRRAPRSKSGRKGK